MRHAILLELRALETNTEARDLVREMIRIYSMRAERREL